MYLHSDGQGGDSLRSAPSPPSVLSVDPPLDLADVLGWLREEVKWPEGFVPDRATLRRFWSGRAARISFEIMVTQASDPTGPRCVLQGVRGKFPKGRRPFKVPRFCGTACRFLRVSSDRLGIWMCSGDCDPYLPAVRDFLDTDRLPTALKRTAAADWLHLDRGDDRLSARLAAHRVARRAVVCVDSRDGDSSRGVFIKTFCRPVPAEQVGSYQAVAAELCRHSKGAIQTPRILDSYTVGRSGVLISERITPEAVPLGESAEDTRMAARLLAALHAIRIPIEKRHSAQGEVETVQRWLAGLRITGRPESDRLCELSEAINDCAVTLPPACSTVVHRDYHRGQVLRRGDLAWLLDLDTLALGDGEVDLSTFAAHLVMDSTIEGLGRREVMERLTLFLGSYVAGGGTIDDERLGFYMLCALSRLGALHLLRGQPRRVIDALWGLAEEVLRGNRPWR
jgi:hypothetical protein